VQCGAVADDYSRNYGCFAEGHFWIGSDSGDLYKIHGEAVTITATYATTGNHGIIQADYDGEYLWIGHFNNLATLDKFDIDSGSVVDTWDLNPGSVGAGGIQGVRCVDGYVWCSLPGPAQVLKFNPATEAVDITITGQTNVNGIETGEVSGQTYLFSACHDFFTRINVDTGTTTDVAQSDVYFYRNDTDDTYVYFSRWGGGDISKFNMETLALEAEFAAGGALNDIAVTDDYLWVVDDGYDVNVVDKTNGLIVCSYANRGQSTAVYEGNYIWVNTREGLVSRISGGLLPITYSSRNVFSRELRGTKQNTEQVVVHHNYGLIMYNAIAIEATGNGVIRIEKGAMSTTFTAVNFQQTPIVGDIEYRIRR